MQYLAEVIKKQRGAFGGSKTELKLLACRRSELSWSAVPGEEMIVAPDDMHYNAGALVMLDLSAGKQVQQHSEAGRALVSILQNFSRLQEKTKTQEEEIEQWKQSLTYQSQELNRREMEIEAAQEQVQQIDEDLERLEKRREEIETAQEEVNRLREEFERKSQELEGAWAQLQGETNRLEERQSELQQMTVLDEAQAGQFQTLLDQVVEAVTPIETIQNQLNDSLASVAQQQAMLDYHWQQLEVQRAAAQQQQSEIDQQIQTLPERWSVWRQAQAALDQARTALEEKQCQLTLKQEYAALLAAQIQRQVTLSEDVVHLVDGSDRQSLQNLEKMSLEELQATARDLEKDLEKMSRFVSSQEEELALQQQTIDDLSNQMRQASEYDRLQLETELADEQDRYQMLNQTLVGQRRNLQERQTTLRLHQTVLAKRQGFPLPENQERTIDLAPLLSQIEQIRHQYAEQLQGLERNIQELQAAVEPLQQSVAQQSHTQMQQWDELRQLEQQVRSQVAATAELWGKVNLYQEFLQPLQDNLRQLKQQSEGSLTTISQFQTTNEAQMQAVANLRETIQQLVARNQSPEMAVS